MEHAAVDVCTCRSEWSLEATLQELAQMGALEAIQDHLACYERVGIRLMDQPHVISSVVSVAAQYGHLAVIRFFILYSLDAGLSQDLQVDMIKQAFLVAAEGGQVYVVAHLIRSLEAMHIPMQVIVDIVRPAILRASDKGRFLVVSDLMHFSISRNIPASSILDSINHSILVSAHNGHAHVTDWLVQRAFDLGVHWKDMAASLKSALQYATVNGHLQAVKCLVEKLVRFDELLGNSQLLIGCILAASKHGHVGIVEYLVGVWYALALAAKSSDRESRLDDVAVQTMHEAIKGAAKYGEVDVLRFLVEFCEDKDMQMSDVLSGELVAACERNHQSVVEFLLSKVETAKFNRIASICIDLTSKSEFTKLLELILNKVLEVRLDFRDFYVNLRCAMFNAAEKGCIEVMRILLNQLHQMEEVSADTQLTYLKSCLVLAFGKSDHKMVEFLVEQMLPFGAEKATGVLEYSLVTAKKSSSRVCIVAVVLGLLQAGKTPLEISAVLQECRCFNILHPWQLSKQDKRLVIVKVVQDVHGQVGIEPVRAIVAECLVGKDFSGLLELIIFTSAKNLKQCIASRYQDSSCDQLSSSLACFLAKFPWTMIVSVNVVLFVLFKLITDGFSIDWSGIPEASVIQNQMLPVMELHRSSVANSDKAEV